MAIEDVLYGQGGEFENYKKIIDLRAAEIAKLQQFLLDLGYNSGEVDGLWGPATNAAWMLFSDNNGFDDTKHILPEQQTQIFGAGERADLVVGPGTDIDLVEDMVDGVSNVPATGAPAESADSGQGFGDGVLQEDEIERIKQDYPTLAHLLEEPEIGPLITQAVEEGWTTNTLIARMEGTNWWKTTTATQREFDASINRDPATIQQRIDDQIIVLRATFSSFGIDPDQDELEDMAYEIQRNGMSETAVLRMVGDRARSTMNSGETGAGADARGVLGSLVQELQAQARAFHLGVAPDQLEEWAIRITEGRWTMDAAEATLRRQASLAYPELADEISRGSTVEDFFAPTKNHLARVLDMNPNSIDLTSNKYADITNFRDDNGNIRPMSFTEVGQWARKQDEWWTTDEAHQKGYGVLNSVLKTFGAI